MYKCWILAEKGGVVLTAGCVCKAGESSVCSHVSAVLYKVSYAVNRGLWGENCTDKQQKWNSGTSKNVLPSTLSTTNLKRPKPGIDLDQYLTVKEFPPLRPIKKMATKEEFQQFCNSSILKDVFQIGGTLFNSTLNSKDSNSEGLDNFSEIQEPFESHICSVDDDYALFDSQSETLSCTSCQSVFEKFIRGKESAFDKLATVTVGQACDPNEEAVDIWKISRKLRITASSAFQIPKRQATDPSRFLTNHVFGKFTGNADTARGQYGEKEAKAWYEGVIGSRINVVGTVVKPTEPWLSASPDGLLGIDTILEIKCPDPDKFDRYLEQKSYEIYKNMNGEYGVRKTKAYYLQVQLCMYCLNRKMCTLLLYFGRCRDPILINVEYDQEFINNSLPKLRSFYFKKLLPFLVDRIHNKTLRIPEQYKCIFE